MLVLPSWLSMSSTDMSDSLHNNHTLKSGQIIGVTPPKAGATELVKYQVLTQDNSGGTLNDVVYDAVMSTDMFGSVADFVEYRLRANKPKPDATSPIDYTQTDFANQVKNIPTEDELLGAHVLIMCVMGQTDQAVILAATRNPRLEKKDKYTPKKDSDGLFYHFSYNGVDFKVDKEGQLEISVNGPQTDDGKLVTSSTAAKGLGISPTTKAKVGSKVTIDKEGDIVITNGDGKQQMTISNKDKKIAIITDDMEVGVANTHSLFAKDSEIDVERTHSVMASDFKVKASSSAVLDSSNVNLGAPVGMSPVSLSLMTDKELLAININLIANYALIAASIASAVATNPAIIPFVPVAPIPPLPTGASNVKAT